MDCYQTNQSPPKMTRVSFDKWAMPVRAHSTGIPFASLARRTFGALALATMFPSPVLAAADISSCVRGVDAEQRISACSQVIAETHDLIVLSRALNARGLTLCKLDRCREAVGDFSKIVKLSPGVAGYFDNYSRALRASGRYIDAVRASTRAVELGPTYAFTYFGKARALEEGRRPDEALQALEQAALVAPRNADIWVYRGQLLTTQRRYHEAYAAFAHALEIDPSNNGIYVHRADAELAEGRLDDAIRDLEHYPAEGDHAEVVRGKLLALRAVRASGATGTKCPDKSGCAADLVSSPASQPTSVTNQGIRNEPGLSGTSAVTCNFHDWTPIDRCVQEYHTDNDPMPTGAPNPRRWNKELAATGAAFVARHPNVQWDHAEWDALAAKNAEESDTNEAEGLAKANPDRRDAASKADNEGNSNETESTAGEIDKCNAPGVLTVLKRLSSAALKEQAFSLLMGNVQDARFDYVGIRQLSFDSTNEHRECAMDRTLVMTYLAHTHRAPERKSVPIRYEIDRQLDGPRGSYVTCKCD